MDAWDGRIPLRGPLLRKTLFFCTFKKVKLCSYNKYCSLNIDILCSLNIDVFCYLQLIGHFLHG